MRRTTGLIRVCAMGAVLLGGCAAVRDASDGGTPGASAGASGAAGTTGSTGKPDAATTIGSGSGGSAGPSGPSTSGPNANGTPKPGEFGSGGPTVDANCGLSMYGLDKIPADLLIVFDRSGSMNEDIVGTLDTRWTAMTAAIGEVVAMTQTSIRWGLKYFPDAAMACGVNDGAVIPIGDTSGPAIATAIVDPAITPTNGRTPTRVGMDSATAYLKTLTDPNPKYILLATDGIPNCVPGDMDTATPDTAGAIQSVKDAALAGFPTFVIGIATTGTAADTTLNEMALGGGQPRAAGPPSYYPVANRADLVAALAMIGGQIGSCSFGLSMVPPDPTNIAVEADGNRVPQDPTHTNGWDYGTGMRSIQLFGTYCDQAKAATIKSVRAIFGCPGIVIP